ncbi:MAG: hypothetical protein ISS71_08370 [Phycisphaerae bacterium]|nr:hypothetical protein [Phycisphaerae bacterium]
MKHGNTLFMFCLTVLTLLTVANAAGEARWRFHFTYGQCPGGDLEVWSTQNCQRMQQIFRGYTKTCKDYEGIVPGNPANDVMFDFYWDYWCNNEDHFKIAIPNYTGSEWDLIELPPWIEASVAGDLDLPSVGDPTGTLQDIYVVVNLQEYLDHHDPVMIDSFFDVYTELTFNNGEEPNLPGFMVSEGPISFNPGASPTESPFEYGPQGPLNGDLVVDGRLTLYNLVESDPLNPQPAFEELNWQGSIQPNPTSPAWGRITMQDVTLSRGIYYFNLVLGDGSWPIANMSVESTGEPQTISAKFNLGPYAGTSSVGYQYCSFSSEPEPTQPTGTTQSESLVQTGYQIGFEVGDSVELVDPEWIPDYCPVKVSGQLPNLGSVVNQPQGQNQCAPGAISNSLKYLQANGKVPASKDTSIAKVGSVIGTTSSGTPASWYLKKQSDPYFTDVVTTRYINAPLTLAKCQQLAKELKDGQDIEMDLKGHVEMLAGIRVKCNDTVELDLFDDNQSDTVSDPMHTSPLTGESLGGTGTQYVDGMELERFVIECPAEKILPYAFLDTWEEWVEAREIGKVRALTQQEGEDYLAQWSEFHDPATGGEPYPDDPFLPAELHVHDGIGGPYGEEENIFLEDAGLVMAWGEEDLPNTDYTSAWALKYDADPDLSNCIITLVVTAPQFSFISGNQINNVSFGLGSPPIGSGPVRSWSWACGPGNPIPWNTPVTLKIDTSKTGMTAATPTATGYVSNPAFNLQNVTWMAVDENGTWVGGPSTAPGPGGFQFMWNYWHWILVSPRTTVNKGIYTKWSQPPVVIDPNNDPPLIQGWDEHSSYNMPVVADDWECSDDRPVTDIHWWGSFFKIIDPATGQTEPWTQPTPPTLPNRFHIGIWIDVPDDPSDPNDYSHPDVLVWENYCDNFVWNFAGYDQDPRAGLPHELPQEPGSDTQLEACFQFTQLLSQDEWFYQKPMDDGTPRVYWLSIAPIWDTSTEPEWEWGWKSRPHFFNDDAVSIQMASPWWPPIVNNTQWVTGIPIQWPPHPDPEGVTWDMAFELTTNEPAYEDDPIDGDISGPDGIPDGEVNLIDLSVIAANWLTTALSP